MLQLKSVTSQDIELRSNDEVVIINQGFLKYYLENYLREGDKIKHVRRIKIVRKLLKDHAEEHRVPLQYSSEAGIEITCRKIRKIFDFKIELCELPLPCGTVVPMEEASDSRNNYSSLTRRFWLFVPIRAYSLMPLSL